MMDNYQTSRRDLFRLGAAGATTIALATHGSANARQTKPPSDLGRKFDRSGHVLRFAGNTVICHLPQQGPSSQPFGVILDYYRVAPWFSFARKIALLPPSSYHMTVFGGANDIGRDPKLWPDGIAIDASIDECSRVVGERLRAGALPPVQRIRMKVDANNTGYEGNTLRIPLEPFDQAELEMLEDLRAKIALAIGVPLPVRGSFQYHITLGYLIDRFSESEQREAVTIIESFKRRMVEASPIIELGSPEYCTFKDMYAFHREFFLGQ